VVDTCISHSYWREQARIRGYNWRMPRFYTRKGDDGYTSLLGEGRVPKYAPQPETVGTIDEAAAALGLARATCKAVQTGPIIVQAQRDLYRIMAEIAASPDSAARFRKINAEQVTWLETQTDALNSIIDMPNEFILAGDSPAGAALDLSRTIVRRAERKVAELWHKKMLVNQEILRYLNRLSSLCFALELLENQAAGKSSTTFAKG
jgi:cob(I)alamin adenosyltransferase